MLSISMFVCETKEEAASLAERFSDATEPGEVLMLDTGEAEAQPLICVLRKTISMGNVNNATATGLEWLLSTVLDSLDGSDRNESRH